MRIHVLQHVPFEGPARIGEWFVDRGQSLEITHLYMGEVLPDPGTFDFLVIMGGPMGVEDVDDYPWLAAETQFIRDCITNDKYIIGVCLGAQLIAKACGAKVRKNSSREIGWYPVSFDRRSIPRFLADVFPGSLEVFHWHGDTFDIPQGAVLFASSEACTNQAFVINDRVVALQFHIETTPAAAASLVENCRDELDGSKFVQSEDEILADRESFTRVNQVLYRLLEAMVARSAMN